MVLFQYPDVQQQSYCDEKKEQDDTKTAFGAFFLDPSCCEEIVVFL